MAFLPSAAKAPFSRSPGRVASSAWRVSIWSVSTATSASTASTASATGAAPSRTIARVVGLGRFLGAQQAAHAGDGQDAAPQIGQPEQPLGGLRHARHSRQADDLGDLVRRQGVELAVDAKRQEALSHSAA